MPVISAALGFVGALGGSYVGVKLNIESTEKLKHQEFELQIVTQRYVLLDRVSKLLGKSPGMQIMWERFSKNEKGGVVSLPDRLLMAEKLADYRGECDAALLLAMQTFGPGTRDAVRALSDIDGPWWTKPREKQQNVLAAMAAEVRYGTRLLPEVDSPSPSPSPSSELPSSGTGGR